MFANILQALVEIRFQSLTHAENGVLSGCFCVAAISRRGVRSQVDFLRGGVGVFSDDDFDEGALKSENVEVLGLLVDHAFLFCGRQGIQHGAHDGAVRRGLKGFGNIPVRAGFSEFTFSYSRGGLRCGVGLLGSLDINFLNLVPIERDQLLGLFLGFSLLWLIVFLVSLDTRRSPRPAGRRERE